MRKWLAVAVALLAVGAVGQTIKPETKTAKDKRMAWWRDARLGMFIHWGLYSIPAGDYGGHTNYGEWIREEAHIPVGEYEKFEGQFNPTKFDADAWVKMAHDAGMKYVVITTKHHDGFNLFDSPLTDWNIAHTPFGRNSAGTRPENPGPSKGRDIMAEMAAACKKYGLKMCWYHSIMDWHHPDYLPRRSWEVSNRPVGGADFRRFVKYLRDEVSWLLTKYGPIGVMWFDGEWESTWNAKDGDALYALCRQLQPSVIVNNRVTVGRGGMDDSTSQQAGDFTTPEQFIPPTGLPGVDWETCMTMNGHWGYNSHDTNWKSSTQLIHNIVDIASKGGNYLLNVGPRADGTFPPEAVSRLRDIGAWMKINGASIHGTTASVFPSLPWGRSTTRLAPRTTQLYLQIFDWPKDGRLVVPGIGNKPVAAHLLAGGREVRIRREGSDLAIEVGPKPSDPICSVVLLTIEGKPIIYRAPVIHTPSTSLVDSTRATLDSGSSELQVRYTTDGADPSEHSTLYTQPIRIERTLTLKAAAFHHGKRVSPVTAMQFEKVVPRPAIQAGGVSGLICREYKGVWNALPDFSKLSPRATTIEGAIGLGDSKEEFWGRRYEGLIQVPTDGVYEFALTSDDGSRLWVDGDLVVDNDGLHSSQTKTGQIALAKGAHRVELGWFNQSGGLELSLLWAKAGSKLRPIIDSAWSH